MRTQGAVLVLVLVGAALSLPLVGLEGRGAAHVINCTDIDTTLSVGNCGGVKYDFSSVVPKGKSWLET